MIRTAVLMVHLQVVAIITRGINHPSNLLRLNVSGGAASYYLKDVTNELFEADTKGSTIGLLS